MWIYRKICLFWTSQLCCFFYLVLSFHKIRFWFLSSWTSALCLIWLKITSQSVVNQSKLVSLIVFQTCLKLTSKGESFMPGWKIMYLRTTAIALAIYYCHYICCHSVTSSEDTRYVSIVMQVSNNFFINKFFYIWHCVLLKDNFYRVLK